MRAKKKHADNKINFNFVLTLVSYYLGHIFRLIPFVIGIRYTQSLPILLGLKTLYTVIHEIYQRNNKPIYTNSVTIMSEAVDKILDCVILDFDNVFSFVTSNTLIDCFKVTKLLIYNVGCYLQGNNVYQFDALGHIITSVIVKIGFMFMALLSFESETASTLVYRNWKPLAFKTWFQKPETIGTLCKYLIDDFMNTIRTNSVIILFYVFNGLLITFNRLSYSTQELREYNNSSMLITNSLIAFGLILLGVNKNINNPRYSLNLSAKLIPDIMRLVGYNTHSVIDVIGNINSRYYTRLIVGIGCVLSSVVPLFILDVYCIKPLIGTYDKLTNYIVSTQVQFNGIFLPLYHYGMFQNVFYYEFYRHNMGYILANFVAFIYSALLDYLYAVEHI